MAETDKLVITQVIPAALSGEVIMSRDAVARSRKPGLRELYCYVHIKKWVVQNHSDESHHPERKHCERIKVASALDYYNEADCYLYILDPTNILGVLADGNSKEEAPERRCRIESVLDSQIVRMIKNEPNNATFRALMMSRLGAHPPPEADSYQKLVDWVEFNFPRIKSGSADSVGNEHIPAIQVRMSYSETEYGRASYSVPRNGNGTIEISGDDLVEIAENSNSFQEFKHGVDQLIEERVSDIETECDWDSAEYDNHETTDSDNNGIEYTEGPRAFFARLRVFAEANLPADLYEKLQ